MANSENLDLKRLDEPKSTTKFNHQIYYQNNFDKIDAAMGAPPSTLTTTAKTIIPAINELESNKVDKETGKGLSTNDFDNTYKQKIDEEIPSQLADIEQDKAEKTDIGLLSGLLTTAKNTIVAAINELFNSKANKAQEAWITLTLVNGTTGNVQIRKNNMGRVEYKGKATPTALGTNMFIIPSGYLLGYDGQVIVPSGATGQGRLRFVSTLCYLNSGTLGEVDFTGVSYVAGA